MQQRHHLATLERDHGYEVLGLTPDCPIAHRKVAKIPSPRQMGAREPKIGPPKTSGAGITVQYRRWSTLGNMISASHLRAVGLAIPRRLSGFWGLAGLNHKRADVLVKEGLSTSLAPGRPAPHPHAFPRCPRCRIGNAVAFGTPAATSRTSGRRFS